MLPSTRKLLPLLLAPHVPTQKSNVVKNLVKLWILLVFSNCVSIGQDGDDSTRQKIKSEIDKTSEWRILDRYKNPVTDEQVQAFFEYIKKNPIIQYYGIDDQVAFYKIRAARNLYKNIDDEAQRKKIIELLLNTFKEIQAERDTLGINPYSETEGYLYVNPVIEPRSDPVNEGDETISFSQRFNEMLDKRIKNRVKIEGLEQIHGNLYDLMTDEMKIPLKGIQPRLERSPEEKARTKEILEKQAAALGRKKPEPEAPEIDAK
jgi:hypothetical protein